jgi:hypothetical protein
MIVGDGWDGKAKGGSGSEKQAHFKSNLVIASECEAIRSDARKGSRLLRRYAPRNDEGEWQECQRKRAAPSQGPPFGFRLA